MSQEVFRAAYFKNPIEEKDYDTAIKQLKKILELQSFDNDWADISSDDSEDVEYDPENNQFVVEKVLDDKIDQGKVKFLVKWLGYEEDDDLTWEPLSNFFTKGAKMAIFLFYKKRWLNQKKNTSKDPKHISRDVQYDARPISILKKQGYGQRKSNVPINSQVRRKYIKKHAKNGTYLKKVHFKGQSEREDDHEKKQKMERKLRVKKRAELRKLKRQEQLKDEEMWAKLRADLWGSSDEDEDDNVNSEFYEAERAPEGNQCTIKEPRVGREGKKPSKFGLKTSSSSDDDSDESWNPSDD